MRRAVQEGTLERVRRSWLLVPDVDARRRAAASVGGRVTCVSAAALAGWWDVGPTNVHVALPRTASRFDRAGVEVHCAQGPVPVHPRAAVDPVLDVLFQVARCRPPVEARAIWESAIRHGAVELDTLARVRWRCHAADRLARTVRGRSDSGPETVFVERMRAIGIDVRQQVWVDGHPLDGVIGERLAVQIDGFRHHSAAGDRRRDLAADARLALRGYTVLRFDYHQVMVDDTHVEDTVLAALAQGLHRANRRATGR
jgi:very-short-patch-repair endonuclease